MSASVAFDGASPGSLLAKRRDQPDQLRPVRVHVRDELVLGGVGDVVAERFGEELIRGGEIFLAMPEQHTRAARRTRSRAVSATNVVLPSPASPETSNTSRPSPPATRLNASDIVAISASRPTTPTAGRTLKRPGNGTAFVAAPPSGSQRTSTVSTGSGRPFNASWPDRDALVTAAPTRHQPHHVRRQDLAALTRRAQPSGLDHRVAEVVVVLAGDLAAAQARPASPTECSRARLSRSMPCCIADRARQRRRRRARTPP